METSMVLSFVSAIGVTAIAVLMACQAVIVSKRGKEKAEHDATVEQLKAENSGLQASLKEERQKASSSPRLLECIDRLAKNDELDRENKVELEHLFARLEVAKDFDQLECISKIGSLARQAAPELDRLRKQFSTSDFPARWHILAAILSIEHGSRADIRTSPVATDAVVNGLGDSHPSIRAYSAFLAGQHKISGVKDILWGKYREDPSYSVRRNCGSALREMGEEVSNLEEKQLPMFGYVMVKAPLAGRSTFDGLLKLYTRAKEPAVIEAAFVQGPHDLVVKVAAGTKLEFDDFVMSVIQAIPAVQYTRTYISANSPRYLCWLREKQTESGQPLSWVLLKVPSLQSGGVVVCAEKIEGVVEAASVYGDWDVILKVQGEHLDESISQVRKIPYVSDTMTMRVEQDKEKPHLAAKRFAWSREFFLT